MATEHRNKKKLVGTVTSDKMDKTVVVRVDTLVKHPVYKKYLKRSAKYKAHDENNNCAVGDKVVLTEARPLSRDKRWRVSEIIDKTL
ncbi:MAG: 30S ribosomal protein S17 [Desulfobacteraceae bacterium 4572_35.1]|nr:MAG: 30S ribosomal protein S17 [Desulfobacteraceae bacterium 4572_35.1]